MGKYQRKQGQKIDLVIKAHTETQQGIERGMEFIEKKKETKCVPEGFCIRVWG